eukprot:TRINITY_DN1550_c1_g3_i1.p1 TRINITY_DN1550_c1_g3~~TRINITY_DN1550_c1_g3_i1.p1  ORF type:complete len:182 (-),score=8.05 TRINITY_DN1550_c1_g3_i1:15-560(-)
MTSVQATFTANGQKQLTEALNWVQKPQPVYGTNYSYDYYRDMWVEVSANDDGQELLEEWVVVTDDDLAAYRATQDLPARGLFSNWPSFNVYGRLLEVMNHTREAFGIGTCLGRISEEENVAWLQLTNSIAQQRVEAISLTTGVVVAAPVLVLGSLGVVAMTSFRHSFELVRRIQMRQLGWR